MPERANSNDGIPMREIALDTETTGLNPTNGDRIVEIGCVELKGHVATEKSYHQYVNPERPMPKEALEIHGLTDEFLVKQPVMSEVVDEFLDFIGTPITGILVIEATIPGRCADPPAPAIITLIPFFSAFIA